MKRIQLKQQETRRGAALVEFAFMAPLFLILILGTIEVGTALRASQIVYQAVRGGARLASMDFSDKIPAGSTANAKVEADVMSFMRAAGLPTDQATVTITGVGAAASSSNFDLMDPNNKFELFRVTATVPYDSISTFPNRFFGGSNLTASIVMRAGRATLSN